MTVKNKILGSLMLMGFGCVPLLAQAGAHDLTIVNNATQPTSCRLNGGWCSDRFPGGVTDPGKTNTVNEMVIAAACAGSVGNNCVAKVYMNNACQAGYDIGTVVFNTKTGIKNIGTIKAGYQITSSGPFNITIANVPTH